MKECVIVGAGDFTLPPVSVLNCEECYVIAADGGVDHLQQAGIEYDVRIGDWDSTKTVINENEDSNHSGADNIAQTITLPVKKDDTDMLAAIKEGIKCGFHTFHLLGAMGGERIDHSIANLQCLKYLQNHGKTGYIYTENQVMTLVQKEKISFSQGSQGYFSVFSCDDLGTVVSLKNVEYEGEHLQLTNDYPLGVSNSFVGQSAEIIVEQGAALLIYPLQCKCKRHLFD